MILSLRLGAVMCEKCPRNLLVHRKCSQPCHFLPISRTSRHDSLKSRPEGHPCDDRWDFSYCDCLIDGLTSCMEGFNVIHSMPLALPAPSEQARGCPFILCLLAAQLPKHSHPGRPRRTSKMLTTRAEMRPAMKLFSHTPRLSPCETLPQTNHMCFTWETR